ncbi:MAG: aspartate dehydrogenase [Thiovulaceae bacterium]|nr:aspartate dehydrogenase [Sulfurimonadaceae bacterium]
MNIGLLGCGNIASMLHLCIKEVNVLAVYDRHMERALAVAQQLGATPTDDFETFLTYELDLVIEAASIEAVTDYGYDLLSKGCDLVVLSSGALADRAFRLMLEETALRHGTRLHLPSGAIFGLDNAGIGKVGGLQKVTMRMVKPPRSLHIETDEKQCLYRGSAFECIKHFPKNANSAVSLSLAAGIDADVEIWADPQSTTIRHEIVMEGAFGSVSIRINNLPSPHNPSTSYLAVLSVCALLSSMKKPITVGS